MTGDAFEAKEDRSLEVNKERRAKDISIYVAFDLSNEAVRMFRNVMFFFEAPVFSCHVVHVCSLLYFSFWPFVFCIPRFLNFIPILFIIRLYIVDVDVFNLKYLIVLAFVRDP